MVKPKSNSAFCPIQDLSVRDFCPIMFFGNFSVSATDKCQHILFFYSSERTFSPHSQSLHICYINETCSSDDSDSELPQNDSKFPASFSPTSCNSYSKMLERRRRSSNSTSSSSRNSLLSITSKSNHSSQRSNLDESKFVDVII